MHYRGITFVIGGHYGLAAKIKKRGDLMLSLSAMTLPHELARVFLLEQVYRAFAILHGLPKTLFEGVAMHELGHVWLIAHGVQGLPAWGEEGFCELLAYRYFQHLNTPVARYHVSSIEKNPDSIYGDGFRRVHALAEKYSFPRLLTILNTTKNGWP